MLLFYKKKKRERLRDFRLWLRDFRLLVGKG